MPRSRTPRKPPTPHRRHDPLQDEDDIDHEEAPGDRGPADAPSAGAGPAGPGAGFVPPPELPIHASLSRAMRATPFGAPMAVVVRVTSLRYTGRTPQGQIGYFHTIYLQDVETGTIIAPRPTADLTLVESAQRLLLEGGVTVAYGRYVIEPPRRKNDASPTSFELLHLGPVPGAAVIGAQPDERTEVQALITGLRERPGAIARHVLTELAEIHHVATEHLPPRFQRCLRLVLLQALSDGSVGEATNPRLSLFYVSEPGQGKGILARYAQTLAPQYRVVQPAQITLPGLFVRMEQRQNQGWITTPGALAKAHGGVCVLHDIHHLPRKDLGSIQSVLMTVCEEGSFTPAKVSDTPYLAECAVHMNGNHHHVILGQSAPRGTHARLQDLGMPLDLFSRVDVVAALHVGDDIDKVAIDVSRQQHDRTPERAQLRRARARRLKLLVSELRTQIPEVDLKPVEGQMEDVLLQIQTIVREYAAVGGDQAALVPQALSLRMARTLRKLIAASARLDGRSVANQDDVDGAAQLLGFKLEVLKWICGDLPAIVPQGTLEQQRRRAEATHDLRRHRLMEQCGGMGPLTLEEIARRVGVGRRAAARDLRQLGLVCCGGKYRVPTPLEREKDEAAAERRGEVLQAAPEREVEDSAEDELVRQRPHQFYDSLPQVPVGVRPMVRSLAWARGGDAADLGKRLLRYATTPVLDPPMSMAAVTFKRFSDPEGEPVPSESANAFARGLQQKDWEARAGFTLAAYTALPYVAEDTFALEGLLKQPDLPVGVRRHVQSALVRMRYFTARWRIAPLSEVLL